MRKKGFTLIELLAVIVILAILALITVPIVLKLVNNARKDSAIRSAENYLDGVKKAVMNDSMNTESEIDECKVQTDGNIFCNEKYSFTVDVDGKRPNDGMINFSNGTISDVTELHFGKYFISGEVEDLVASTKSSSENRADGEYLVGDKITYKGERYYVISRSSSSQEYVTALKMWPLTKSEIESNGLDSEGKNHISGIEYGEYPNTTYRGSIGEKDGFGTIAWHASESCFKGVYGSSGIETCNDTWGSCWTDYTINDYDDFSGCPTSYDSSDVKVIVDNWSKTALDLDDLVKVDGYKARLLSSNEAIKNLKYSVDEGTSSVTIGSEANTVYFATSKTPRWIKNSGYNAWMINIDDDSREPSAQFVANGAIGSMAMYNSGGTIRPVINLKKTAIGS